jgi:hypothetical protein
MRFQYRTLPQIIRLKTNRYQADGSSFYRLWLHFIVWDSTEFSIMIEYLRSARSFIQYHLTPVRSVHHPEEQRLQLLGLAIPRWHILSIQVQLYGIKRGSHTVFGGTLNKSWYWTPCRDYRQWFIPLCPGSAK